MKEKIVNPTQTDMWAKRTRIYGFLYNINPLRVHLSFGPTYSVTTKQGELVIVRTVFTSPLQTVFNDKNPINGFFFLAQNQQGDLTGMRRADLSVGEKSITTKGAIVTFEENKGIATCIELAEMDMLQRIANITGKPVTEIGINDNGRRLRKKEEQLKQATISERAGIEKLVESLQEQQTRWQSLWGDRGKLGFKQVKPDMYEKGYPPQLPYALGGNLVKTGDIVLSRIDYKDGRNLIFGFVEELSEFNDNVEKERKRYFYDVLLPKLRSTSAWF